MSLSRHHRENRIPAVEINVVPLVDVALVLLIIFMVTATFVKSQAMNVNLPSASSDAVPQTDAHEITIIVDQKGAIDVNGTEMTDDAAEMWFRREADLHGTSTRVTVYGDGLAPYARVIRVISLAEEAGFSKVLAATQPESSGQHGTH